MRIAACLLLAALALVPAAAAERFEVILRNGTIVDGSGLLPYPADIAIAEGHIARIGNLSRMIANLDIDVAGLYVAPGFIEKDDSGSRDTPGRGETLLTRGVTLRIVNGDAAGTADLSAGTGRLDGTALTVNVGAFTILERQWPAREHSSGSPGVEEAVRHRTARAAAAAGLADRGYLAHGMSADVVVFNGLRNSDGPGEDNVAATLEGVRHVFVNGVLALRNGQPTGVHGGRLITRGTSLPGRPVTADIARHVVVRGKAGSLAIDIDVSQAQGARQARGRTRIEVPDAGQRLSVSEFGVLQVADDWVSFTAEAKINPEGHIRPITVILDRGDPAQPGGIGAVIVEIDGARAFRGAIARDAIRLISPRR